jgi:hypothetical protein
VAVEVELDYTTSQPIEGELATFIVRIRNVGEHYVILRDLHRVGAGKVATWQRSMPGFLREKSREEFTYDPRKPARFDPEPERPVFNTSLIVPGEEIIFKPRIRLLNLPVAYALDFFAYGGVDVKNNVYFLKDKDDRPMRFVRLWDEEELRKALSPNPTPMQGSHRTVIFPYAETIQIAPRRIAFTVGCPLERRTFTPDDALRRIAVERAAVAETSYYSGLDVWAFRSSAGLHWVGPQTIVQLPAVNNLDLLCFALDSLPQQGSILFEFRPGVAQVFAEHAPAFRIMATPVEGEARSRYTAVVTRPELVSFLEALRKVGFKVEVAPAESGFRLLVTR